MCVLLRARQRKAGWRALDRLDQLIVCAVGVAVVATPPGIYLEHQRWMKQNAIRKEQLKLARQRAERNKLAAQGFASDDDGEEGWS